MSCQFNSELLVAPFWADHPQRNSPFVFGFSRENFPFRYFPGKKIPFPPTISQFPKGNSFSPEDIPIPQEINRPRAPIPPGTKCWFAGFIFGLERPNELSDYDLKYIPNFLKINTKVIKYLKKIAKINKHQKNSILKNVKKNFSKIRSKVRSKIVVKHK